VNVKKITAAEKRAIRKMASAGGKTASAKLSPEERRQRARKAVAAREAKRKATKERDVPAPAKGKKSK
jgi:hypothetical protein